MILVTGSSGFIGSHFLDLLDENKLPYKKFQGDILDMNDVQRGLRDTDTVVHFAGVTYLPLCLDIDETAMKVNVEGTLNLLRCHSLIKKFVFLSSASIYGMQDSFPITEDAEPKPPLETYSISKLLGEVATRLYADTYKFNYVIVRLFNVFGPRQSDIFSIPAFIQRGLQGKITVFGDAERDYIYVKDVVSAILDLTLNHNRHETPIYNIASGKCTHVIDVAKMIGKLCNADVVEEKSTRIAGIPKLHGSYDKINKETGWKPEYSLEQGLKETYDYAKHLSTKPPKYY